jgi:hypothetical protein
VKKSGTPASPSSRASDASIHRKFRTLLHELRSIANTWDDIVLVDGLKAARTLVDSRTELECVPNLSHPLSGSVIIIGGLQQCTCHGSSRRAARISHGCSKARRDGQMYRSTRFGSREACKMASVPCLSLIMSILQMKLLQRMSSVLDNMDALMFEAEKLKGFQWCHEEPLWTSWPIEKFGMQTSHPSPSLADRGYAVLSLSGLTTPYHRSLALHKELVDTLRSHTVSFEESRSAISQWVEQPYLRDEGWHEKWEDLCEVEVEKWDAR